MQDRSAAEAFSEPLLREADFLVQRIGSVSLPLPGPNDLAAVCSTYVTGGEGTATDFELAAQNERPYASTYIFIRGFQSSVPGLQNEVYGRSRLNEAAASGEFTRIAIEKTNEQQLRTIASFLLFSSEAGDYRGMIAVPRCIVEQAGAEVMGVSEIPEGKAGKITESRLHRVGFLIGAMSLPSIGGLGGLIDAHPAIAGYTDLSRGERRAKILQESKTIREKSKK